MRSYSLLFATFFMAFMAISLDSQAQIRTTRSTKSKKEEDKKSFKDRLWYGGGFTLGFNQFNSPVFGNGSLFGVGISPMVGYKIFGPISAGPRLELTFLSLKSAGQKAQGFWNYETGIFVRAKVYRGFFLHGEIGSEWEQQPDKSYIAYENPYFGAGYNWGGGGGGTEIAVLYNFRLANDINTTQQPIDYRFAITWKF